MKPFWEEEPEEAVERLSKQVEELRTNQARHSDDLREQLENQFHQQQFEAAARAEQENLQRYSEQSEHDNEQKRTRLGASHKVDVKQVLEAAVYTKRGIQLASPDGVEKAIEDFLDFLADLISKEVYLIAEFPDAFETLSAPGYASFKAAQQIAADHQLEDAYSLVFEDHRFEEAKRLIDFEVVLPDLSAVLRKRGAPGRLLKKADDLTSRMKTISKTLEPRIDHARELIIENLQDFGRLPEGATETPPARRESAPEESKGAGEVEDPESGTPHIPGKDQGKHDEYGNPKQEVNIPAVSFQSLSSAERILVAVVIGLVVVGILNAILHMP